MKIPVLILSVLLLVSCNYRFTKEGRGVTVEKEIPEPFTIKGTYKITSYVFAEVSAMDDEKAKEWLGKELVIDELFHFNFNEVESYKDLSPDKNECKCTNLMDPYSVAAEKFYDEQVSLKELNVTEQELTIYESECTDYPLQKVALTNDHRLIFSWDGVYFILTKM